MDTRTQVGAVAVVLVLASGVTLTDLGAGPSGDSAEATQVSASVDGGAPAPTDTNATPVNSAGDTASPGGTPTSPTSTPRESASPPSTTTTRDAPESDDGADDRSDYGRQTRSTPSTHLTLTHNVSVG